MNKISDFQMDYCTVFTLAKHFCEYNQDKREEMKGVFLKEHRTTLQKNRKYLELHYLGDNVDADKLLHYAIKYIPIYYHDNGRKSLAQLDENRKILLNLDPDQFDFQILAFLTINSEIFWDIFTISIENAADFVQMAIDKQKFNKNFAQIIAYSPDRTYYKRIDFKQFVCLIDLGTLDALDNFPVLSFGDKLSIIENSMIFRYDDIVLDRKESYQVIRDSIIYIYHDGEGFSIVSNQLDKSFLREFTDEINDLDVYHYQFYCRYDDDRRVIVYGKGYDSRSDIYYQVGTHNFSDNELDTFLNGVIDAQGAVGLRDVVTYLHLQATRIPSPKNIARLKSFTNNPIYLKDFPRSLCYNPTDDCPICEATKNEICLITCGHAFCVSCLTGLKNKKCPSCNTSFTSIKEDGRLLL